MRTFGLGLIVWSCAVVGGAQTPAKPAQPVQPVQAVPPPPAVGASPAQPPAKPAPPPPQESFAYESGGRRDPFVNLLGTGSDVRLASRRGEGTAGLIVAEITVSGIVQSRGSLVAMVQGPDRKTYLVHTGDKFLDGTVKTVTPQGLIIVQEVKDPLSLVKQREIRKQLRSLEDAKQ
jgi:Tfp pilus assembly protein PilP